MKNWPLQRAQHNQQILDEAAEWFVDVREGDPDAAGEQEFVRWLRRSPDHIRAYLEVAAFWADVPQLAAKQQVDIDALIAYARADDNVISLGEMSTLKDQRKQSRRESSTRHRPQPLAVAAAAIAVLALAAYSGFWAWANRGQTYETDIGEQRSVTLTDGSTIDMNAKSRIRISFSEQERGVELLDGEALFTVARDPVRPFIVSSDSTRVRAIGTQFVVYRRKSGTTVTVLEGRVSVLAAEAVEEPAASGSTADVPNAPVASPSRRRSYVPVFLTAGEQVMMSARIAPLPQLVDMATATAWTQRQIVFQGTPLTEVVEEFNRYNLRQMVILDPDLSNVRVSGIFSSTQPASLLRFLREQVGLVVSEGEDTVDISRPTG